MTPSLPPVQPASAPSASPAAPSADGSAEVPFSQVLSGEIAQQRESDGNKAEAAGHKTAAEDARTGDPAAEPSAAAAADERLAKDSIQADATATPAADAMLAIALPPDMPRPARSLPTARAAAADDAAAGDTAATAGGRPAGGLSARGLLRDSGADAQRSPAPADSAPIEVRTRSGLAESLAQVIRPEAARIPDRLPEFAQALLNAHSAQAASVVAAELRTSERLNPQVGTAAWNQALGEKIVWMAAGNQQSATLTLNPPNLGPLQVVLNVSNEQATASFYAAQPEVRQALENALPRLRDMMQDAGIQLGQGYLFWGHELGGMERHDNARRQRRAVFIDHRDGYFAQPLRHGGGGDIDLEAEAIGNQHQHDRVAQQAPQLLDAKAINVGCPGPVHCSCFLNMAMDKPSMNRAARIIGVKAVCRSAMPNALLNTPRLIAM